MKIQYPITFSLPGEFSQYILYWEGPHQLIQEETFAEYVKNKGFTLLNNIPRDFISQVNLILTEELLNAMCIPESVQIIVPCLYEKRHPELICSQRNIHRTRFHGLRRCRGQRTQSFFHPDWNGFKSFIFKKI